MSARISIDSRTIEPGEIYVALRGENHDGHDFVEAALQRGAGAAWVETGFAARAALWPEAMRERLRFVPDPLAALQERARTARREWGKTLIAITGSAGKTTTKDMIAAVLGTRYQVLKTEGNFNNHVGVPLTLLRLEPRHELAVVEMGMNHAGEIARLAEIAEPNVGVFTNVGEAHLGNFDSIEGIAAAKRELALAIPAAGALILNAEDARVARFGDGFGGKVITYRAGRIPLAFAGRHHQANAAAALAVGELFGVEAPAARAALFALAPGAGRGQRIERAGAVFINDCYNANPQAMAEMLRVLAASAGGRRIAVLGEMRELGAESAALHRKLGRQVAELALGGKLDALFAVSGEAARIREAADAAGWKGPSFFYPDALAAAPALLHFLRPGDVVLLKGSHAIHLESVLPS